MAEKNKDIIIQVDDSITNLEEFINANTGEGVDPLDEDIFSQIKDLKIGEELTIDSGVGGRTVIKRIEIEIEEDEIEEEPMPKKKSKLKEAVEKRPTKKELEDIAKKLNDRDIKEWDKSKTNINHIIGYAHGLIGADLTEDEANIALDKFNKLNKPSKLKEISSKTKEAIEKAEEKVVEKIEKLKDEEDSQYVKINDLDKFAAKEFTVNGKMMNLKKAVRGFRDKRGDKVIIYHNSKELQKFIDDNGIHATVFETKEELNEWLTKNFIK